VPRRVDDRAAALERGASKTLGMQHSQLVGEAARHVRACWSSFSRPTPAAREAREGGDRQRLRQAGIAQLSWEHRPPHIRGNRGGPIAKSPHLGRTCRPSSRALQAGREVSGQYRKDSSRGVAGSSGREDQRAPGWGCLAVGAPASPCSAPS
jgi:hypothetical protein